MFEWLWRTNISSSTSEMQKWKSGLTLIPQPIKTRLSAHVDNGRKYLTGQNKIGKFSLLLLSLSMAGLGGPEIPPGKLC